MRPFLAAVLAFNEWESDRALNHPGELHFCFGQIDQQSAGIAYQLGALDVDWFAQIHQIVELIEKC